MIHVFAFTYHRLCPNDGSALLLISNNYIQGQWQEIEPQLGQVDCEVCKLVVLIMRANRLEHLFNSNQSELSRTLKKLMNGES